MKRHERMHQRQLSAASQVADRSNQTDCGQDCQRDTRLRTRVVGLRHRRALVTALVSDQAWALTPIRIERKGDHQPDRNAIAVIVDRELAQEGRSDDPGSSDRSVLGYLPASFSLLLSPLLDSGQLSIDGVRFLALESESKAVPTSLAIEIKARGAVSDEVMEALDEAALGDLSRQHFSQALCRARQRFVATDLISEDELLSASLYTSLSYEAQTLYVNLLQRKPGWFLYSEQIRRCDFGSLLECSSLLQDGSVPFERRRDVLASLLPCLTAPELRALHRRCLNGAKGKGDKAGVLSKLQQYIFSQRCIDGTPYFASALFARNFAECCSKRCRPSARHLAALIRLYRIETLNFDLDVLSMERLSNLKLVRFMPTPLSSATPFQTREQILDLESALELLASCEGLLNDKQYALAVDVAPVVRLKLAALARNQLGLPCHWLQFHPATVYCSVLYRVVKAMLKLQRYEDAVNELMFLLNDIPAHLLTGRRRGKCWVRMLLIVDVHLKQTELAFSLCELALDDAVVDSGSKIALQDRTLRLLKRDRNRERPISFDAVSLPINVPIETIVGRPLNCKSAERSRFFGYEDDVVSVEELALQYFAKDGWQGLHDEGCLIRTLFGLLMWDVIWRQDIPNVFMASCQDAPLDLGTTQFYTTRRDYIESRLQHIQTTMMFEVELSDIWMKHSGELCRGVVWDRWTLDQLVVVCACIGRESLAAVFRLFAMDYSMWAGGLPDLTIYHPERRELRFVEVKGPNDRLSEQQRAWLSRLHRFGFDCSVLKIKPPDKKAKTR